MKKSKSIEVSGQQLYELNWFCKNVAGVRVDMYKMQEVADKLEAFDNKITRLEKSAANIEEWIKKIDEQTEEGV
jgi:hypothetical protein